MESVMRRGLNQAGPAPSRPAAGARGAALAVTVGAVADLTQRERDAWEAMTREGLHLSSPYFSLAYHDAVSAVRADVRVAVIRRAGALLGFWPFQRGPLGHARPVGGPLSDHHGLIALEPEAIDMRAVLRTVGVGAFEFHGAIAAQAPFRACGVVEDGSWVVDLGAGMDVMMRRQKKLGGNTFRNIASSVRKMQADGGRLTFRFEDRRPDAFDALLRWKSAQYLASGHFDLFTLGWTRALLQRLMAAPQGGGRGVLSSLELDGEIAAVHFGLLGPRALHYWFPAYDPALARRGPGNALLMHVMEALCEAGVSELHLGPGEFRYKAALGSWQIPLAVGAITTASPAGLARRAAGWIERRAEALPLGPASALPRRVFRRIDRMDAFRP